MKSTQTLPTVEPVDQELVDALAAHRALEADREATVTEHRRLLAIINPGPDDPARDGLDVLDAREALPAAASARNRAEALVRRSHRRVEAAQAAVRA